jgi:chaperone required for assembly of F1-ATPase
VLTIRAVKAMLIRAGLASLALGLALAGCSTNPITGRSQLVGLVSEDEAIQGSAKAYQQMMADLDKKQQIERSGEKDSARARKIQEISDRLIAQAIKYRPDSASWR